MPLTLLPFLLGFLPVEDAAPTPPPLARTASVQVAYNATPAARAFRERHGPWSIRWDERNGTPRALLGPGAPLAERDALVEDLARLAGVDPADLELRGRSKTGERDGWHYVQRAQGRRVHGAFVDVYAERGRIGFVFASLHHAHAAPWSGAPASAEVLPIERDGALRYVVARPLVVGPVTEWRDQRGVVVLREDSRSYAEDPLLVSHEERTVGDTVVTDPARGVLVEDAVERVLTDSLGFHDAGPPFDVTLEGPELAIWRQGAVVTVPRVSDDVLDFAMDLSPAASSVLYHFHVVRDWLAARWPEHRWLPEQVQATVDSADGCCNAYYSSGTLTFLIGNQDVYNLGRIGDVVYHEYGHGVHHYLLEGGTFAGDVSEGSADYVAATVLDDAVLARNYNVNGDFIRRIDEDRVYPDNLNGEPHNDGLIWASFLWNLRELWSADMGVDAGVEATDRLFLESLSFGPGLTDLYEAVLVADDEDGDLSNGTPHGCALRELLAQHGLAPSVAGGAVLDHVPLGPQASAATAYPVTFGLWALPEACEGAALEQVWVHFAVDPNPAAAPDEIPWVTVDAVAGEGGHYTVELPRQPAGSRVVYAISWADADNPEARVFSHGGSADGLYAFWVGDRRALWCEGFEGEAAGWTHGPGLPEGGDAQLARVDQWEIGAPGGAVFEPESAFAGAAIFGTAVSGDGQYLPSNQQFARSPAVSLDGAWPTMTLLAFQRHLTVEDGLYDQATLELRGGGEPVELWRNPSTERGETHVLDVDWTLQELDLAPFLDRSPVDFAWTLTSDQGLEFGGWSLDEVCVLTLDDVPGHFRVDDLVATDDADQVTVRWTNPWVRGVAGSRLIRNREHTPTGPDDGEVLDEAIAHPGEARELVDAALAPGERAWYAVYVSDDTGLLYAETVTGENAEQGGVPAPEPDPVDSGLEPEQSEYVAPPEPRCSCASGPSGGPALIALALLALCRRRDDDRGVV